ncbi:MAG: penicillin-binding transpeptidase domain-containing protein, partial [Solirubrobacteraceae bacterium]
YPLNDLASQVLGIVSRITGPETADPFYKGVNPNDSVGQSGLEASYDRYLRGVDGAQKVKVDAFGNFVGVQSQTPPTAGDNLKLSLNAKLEQVGQQALQQSIDTNYPANGGAFVAMNPNNGEIYAMGSLPTYNANVFTKPVPYSTYNSLFGPNSGDPQVNRAYQSAGPTGSTFKPITATAALESGAWSVGSTFDDTGQYCFSGQCRHNAGNAVDGSLDLVNAIKVSSDDFFYNLGALTNPADPSAHPKGGPLDTWAYNYGIGRYTGIDLPDELNGTLPSPAWRAGRNKLEAECDSATGPFRYTNRQKVGPRKLKGFKRSPKHAPGGCGIADGTDRPWSIGDNESLAVGQGDVQVTPLQLAVAYAALANGGTVVRPHLGMDVQQPDGTVLQTITAPPSRHIAINPLYRDTILSGLHDA